VIEHRQQAEALDEQVQKLRAALLLKEDLVVELEAKVKVHWQERAALQMDVATSQEQFQAEIAEKESEARALETQLAFVKGLLAEAEASVMAKDETIAATAARHFDQGEENRQLHLEVEEKHSQIVDLTNKNHDLLASLNSTAEDLESIRELYTELKEHSHRAALNQLADSEASVM